MPVCTHGTRSERCVLDATACHSGYHCVPTHFVFTCMHRQSTFPPKKCANKKRCADKCGSTLLQVILESRPPSSPSLSSSIKSGASSMKSSVFSSFQKVQKKAETLSGISLNTCTLSAACCVSFHRHSSSDESYILLGWLAI